MPTQLSTLYRFFKHEEEGSNPVWNIASVPYDGEFRIYRIYYADTDQPHLSTDTEKVVPITKKWRTHVESILQVLLGILESNAYAPTFREACIQIMKEDPWLEEYMKDVSHILTKTLQSPCR